MIESHSAAAGPSGVPNYEQPARRSGQLGVLPGAAPAIKIPDIVCTDEDSSQKHAVSIALAAMRWSMPLVLRGCAASMPAIRRWRNSTYLNEVASHAFAPALARRAGQEFTGSLDELDPSLLADTWWAQPFGEALWEFALDEGAKGLWASSGGKRAAAHYDTFDNLHVVVSGTKEFRLVAPEAAASMYVDFPLSSCPDHGVFGCDHLGCYAFVPFNADDVDLAVYPRVADVQVHTATLHEGDTLLIPALWFHYIIHHPLAGDGRCFALTFTQQKPWGRGGVPGPRSPVAADVTTYARETVTARERDPRWAEWLSRRK